MAICKFCKEEIDRLTRVGSVREYADFCVDGGSVGYDNFETDYGNTEGWEFRCPECGECLAHDEESAGGLLGATATIGEISSGG